MCLPVLALLVLVLISGVVSSSVAASGSSCSHDFMSLMALAAFIRPSRSYCPPSFSCGPNGCLCGDFSRDKTVIQG